ncbi:MAG: hypothetical protein KatS3mg035_0079 [Bacteroidia bacterium]|nr:MAG: hypothetical protein KatS3mg035_0079 [Bacteroidia bacterium]
MEKPLNCFKKLLACMGKGLLNMLNEKFVEIKLYEKRYKDK